MTVEFKSYEHREAMVAALADDIAARLTDAVTSRGAASLIVSGGSTPKPLFEILAQRELPWDTVTVSLSDERWEDPDSPDSNEYLVRQSLLMGKAAVARFVSLKTLHASPEEGENEVEQRLSEIPSPFDVVLLGMGDDGHTASLFPHARTLPAALDMRSGRSAMALTPRTLPEHAPYPRMTLTLPRLLDSDRIVLLIAGDGKREVYEEAAAGGEIADMPVRAVLQQTRTPVVTYWAP